MANEVFLDITQRGGSWSRKPPPHAEDYVFVSSDGYLSLNCKRCGDPEEGTLICFIDAGDELERVFFEILDHECGKEKT